MVAASLGRRSREAGALTALYLHMLVGYSVVLIRSEPGDGLALGFQTQTAVALAGSGNPDAADGGLGGA
jgi:hypothetical protein